MSPPAPPDGERNAGSAYHLIRAAHATFRRAPDALEPPELERARRLARESLEIESRVLGSGEARHVEVPDQQVDWALAAVAARYGDREQLMTDLERNGLDEGGLREALRRQLRFDRTLRLVGSRAEPVGEAEIAAFYAGHRERFARAEGRRARHLLITVNPAYPENTPRAARARIERIAAELAVDPGRFDALARRHSECATALAGGALGVVGRGRLLPGLDAALFDLPAGGLSGVVETELGLHLILCESIEPARRLRLAEVGEEIRRVLEGRRQREHQQAWLAGLRRQAGDGTRAEPGLSPRAAGPPRPAPPAPAPTRSRSSS